MSTGLTGDARAGPREILRGHMVHIGWLKRAGAAWFASTGLLSTKMQPVQASRVRCPAQQAMPGVLELEARIKTIEGMCEYAEFNTCSQVGTS